MYKATWNPLPHITLGEILDFNKRQTQEFINGMDKIKNKNPISCIIDTKRSTIHGNTPAGQRNIK